MAGESPPSPNNRGRHLPGRYVSLDPAPLGNGFYIVGVPWNLRVINMTLVVLCACLTAQTVNEHLSLAALLLLLS